MTETRDRLYDLLPAVYRMRDADAGEPLRALLEVIDEQVEVVDADIEQLYENWFIETCDEWVVPYIGDLVGETIWFPIAGLGAAEAADVARRLQVAPARKQVGDAIGRRRRKGTPAVLEELASGVAGWPARVVESFRLLRLRQSVKHLRLDRGRSLDVREMAALDAIGSPFDSVARTLDVRRITSHRTRSRWNIPAVAVFAWRLRRHAHTRAQAYCIDRVRNRYTFSVLGNDGPLLAAPLAEPDVTHIAQEPNVPAFITRRELHERGPELYGPGRSIRIWRGYDHPVPVHDVVAADLSSWGYRPLADEVAVDPELGRIAFSSRHEPDDGVWVTFGEGFPDDIGGGEYPRTLSQPGPRRYYTVGRGATYPRIMDAVAAFEADRADGKTAQGALIEIVDNEVYQERVEIELAPGDRLELRAADGKRPVIRLLDLYANRPDQMRIRGLTGEEEDDQRPCPPSPPRLLLDGLLIEGRSVEIVGPVGEVDIRHCTLVPGWSLEHDCRPANESEPSIELVDTQARLVVERSIVGSILVNVSEVAEEPLVVSLADSVLDATSDSAYAVAGPDDTHAHAYLTVVRCTVFGRVLTHAVELGSNSIFTGDMRVARRQLGCLRHSSVPAGSRTPRRHRCQPDLARAAAVETGTAQSATPAERDALVAHETLRVKPFFDSVRYGKPTYARLALTCAAEISRGADDGSEMGVYHDLFNPQREDALRRALADFTPAGMDVGLVFAT